MSESTVDYKDLGSSYPRNASRMIAAFIDFLLITALSLTLEKLFSGIDFDNYVLYDLKSLSITLFITTVYFGIGNSYITRGQTLGKKAFGLHTVKILSKHDLEISFKFLTLKESILRFYLFIGLIILIGEVPDIFFKAKGLIINQSLQELNLYLAMQIMLFNGFLILFTNKKLGLHDIFVKSQVLHVDTKELPQIIENEIINATIEKLAAKSESGKIVTLFILALALNTISWSGSISKDPSIASIKASKFKIEKLFPVKIVEINKALDYGVKKENSLIFSVFLLNNSNNLSHDKRINLAANISEEINKNVINIKNFNLDSFLFYFLPDEKETTQTSNNSDMIEKLIEVNQIQ